MARYLALDMGAESGRLAIVDISTRIEIEEVHRYETPVIQDSLGRRCWDFPKIIQEIIIALTMAASKGPFQSLSVDTWGLDFGFLDKNEKLIGLPVSYRDHRTDGILEKTASEVGLNRLHLETGCQLLEVNSIFQLVAIRDQTPEDFERAEHLLMMPDLILHALTGKIGTEYTIATTIGLYDVVNNCWSSSLINDLKIPRQIFGNVEDPGTIRGVLTPELQKLTGLNSLTCIATASHDTACAVVATPIANNASAYISSGTWSLMGVELAEPVVNQLTLSQRLTNEGGFDRTMRVLRNITGLWIVQEVRRDLRANGENYSYPELVDLAAAEGENWSTLISVDDPRFVHAGGMIERIQNFAAESKQKVPTTPGEIIQCVLLSLALQYAKTADVLQEVSGIPLKTIHIVGGGSKNAYLNQLTADISGREVIAGPTEATIMGNAIIQAVATGGLASVAAGREIIRASDSDFKIYKPNFMPDLQMRVAEVREYFETLKTKELT